MLVAKLNEVATLDQTFQVNLFLTFAMEYAVVEFTRLLTKDATYLPS